MGDRRSDEETSIGWEERDGVRHVTVSGEVDVSSVPDLGHAFDAPRLVVDMSAVTFIDSAGVGALILAEEVAETFHLRASRRVIQVLEMVGVSDRLQASIDSEK